MLFNFHICISLDNIKHYQTLYVQTAWNIIFKISIHFCIFRATEHTEVPADFFFFLNLKMGGVTPISQSHTPLDFTTCITYFSNTNAAMYGNVILFTKMETWLREHMECTLTIPLAVILIKVNTQRHKRLLKISKHNR